ncbi:MAG TPA: hypothetical protein VFO78_11870 [Candidatus Limnocylindrales bacterium]|nr:hypothetical protein [Candidatus Limnocylindrales bacterium]
MTDERPAVGSTAGPHTENEAGRPSAVPDSQVDPGAAASTDNPGHAQDRETQPPAGQATGSGGGFGVGSDRSAGGSGEPDPGGTGEASPTSDDQTEWLRDAPGGPDTE